MTAQPAIPQSATVYERGLGLLVRFVWWLFIGWWATGLWMGLAWLIQLTVIGIPVALMMFSRTRFIASLYRY